MDWEALSSAFGPAAALVIGALVITVLALVKVVRDRDRRIQKLEEQWRAELQENLKDARMFDRALEHSRRKNSPPPTLTV